MNSYRNLASQKIVETLTALSSRIGERFPGSGLLNVCRELTVMAEQTTDRAEKTKLYTDAQQRIWKDAPWAFLVTEQLLSARSKNLTGLYVMPDASFNFDEIELK